MTGASARVRRGCDGGRVGWAVLGRRSDANEHGGARLRLPGPPSHPPIADPARHGGAQVTLQACGLGGSTPRQ